MTEGEIRNAVRQLCDEHPANGDSRFARLRGWLVNEEPQLRLFLLLACSIRGEADREPHSWRNRKWKPLGDCGVNHVRYRYGRPPFLPSVG